MGSIIALPEVIFLISATWNSYGYYGLKEIEGAKWIQENTSPNARFLTSNNPNQFIPMLTGRPIYIGYSGWLWSQGRGDLLKRRSERAHSFLKTGNPTLICEDGIKYVLWDNALLRTYPKADIKSVLSVVDVVFSQKLESETREILEIRCPNS